MRAGVSATTAATSSLVAAVATWLTLRAWAPLAEGPAMLSALAVGCAVVGLVGAVLRLAAAAWPVVTVAQLLAVVVWLGHGWAPGTTLAGLVPTPGTLRSLGHQFASGTIAAEQHAAPVPQEAATFVLLMLAAGLATAVVVDLLACGLRRAPLAALPLLAVYTVPVVLPGVGVPWSVFALAALGFLALLVLDQHGRLVRWGRRLSDRPGVHDDDTGHTVGLRSLPLSATRIGLVTTGLAVVLPTMIPTFNAGLFSAPGSGARAGGDTVIIPNLLVNLRRDLVRGPDVDVVRVETDDPDPSYLRLSVLDRLTEESWAPSDREIPADQRADGLMPNPPGLSSTVPRLRYSSQVRVSEAFDSVWLPTPYPLATLVVRGDWRYDESTLDVVSAVEGVSAAGIGYSLASYTLAPDAETLARAAAPPDGLFDRFTHLPDDVPAVVGELARDLTREEGSSFEKAVRLQRWFRDDGGFTYSTDRPAGNSLQTLESFLTEGPEGRVGYCEQFAAAMAVMGRVLDIPSRVAVGFLRPEPVGDDVYMYSTHDLHAWPEMYFEGVGWIRFEPTPADRATRVPGYTVPPTPSDDPTSAPTAGQNEASAQPTEGPNAGALPDEGSSGPGADAAGGVPGWVWALLLVTAVTALLPWAARTVVRQRALAAGPTTGRAERAWRELRATALDLRIPWDDSLTARQQAAALQRYLAGRGDRDPRVRSRPARGRGPDPRASAALGELLVLVERGRFAQRAGDASRTRELLEICVRSLRAGRSGQELWQARLLPVSLVRPGTPNREGAVADALG